MAGARSTPAASYPIGALPVGTRLGEFEVRRVLGIGGFGIVYLAFDHLLEREVALKEYMPSSLAERKDGLQLTLISQSNADTFALGLRSFVNEARLLARFDHPSLVKVHRFWEANGTAYMAMALYKGRTVRDVRLGLGAAPPTEAWVRSILEPLLGAVEKLHSEDIYHRDIAPDNILVEADGRPVLLDFGAARRVISDRTQALTAILKPSYAPIEQYADMTGMKQGAWTDIYALGATMHFLLLGKPPPPAPGRSIQDTMTPLATQNLPGCSRGFLELVDWMLTPAPSERPQSVAALRDVLSGRTRPPSLTASSAAPDLDLDATLPLGAVRPQDLSRTALPTAASGPPPASEEATVIMPRGAGTGFSPTQRAPAPMPTPQAPTQRPALEDEATVVRPSPTAYQTLRQAPQQPTRAAEPMPPRTAAVRPTQAQPGSRPPAPASSGGQTVHMASSVPAPARKAASPWIPVVAGMAVALLIGGGLWWFLTLPASIRTSAPPVPASAAEAAAASGPATTAPSTAPQPQALPQPQPQAIPSQPPVAAPPVTSPTPAPAQPARPPAAVTQPAQRPAANPPPQGQINAPRPPEPSPTVVLPAPAVVAPSAPAPSAGAVPPPASEARPTSPSERCAKELPLVRLVCIELACNRAEFAKHPECAKLKAEQAGRRTYEGN